MNKAESVMEFNVRKAVEEERARIIGLLHGVTYRPLEDIEANEMVTLEDAIAIVENTNPGIELYGFPLAQHIVDQINEAMAR